MRAATPAARRRRPEVADPTRSEGSVGCADCGLILGAHGAEACACVRKWGKWDKGGKWGTNILQDGQTVKVLGISLAPQAALRLLDEDLAQICRLRVLLGRPHLDPLRNILLQLVER